MQLKYGVVLNVQPDKWQCWNFICESFKTILYYLPIDSSKIRNFLALPQTGEASLIFTFFTWRVNNEVFDIDQVLISSDKIKSVIIHT